jgi:RimJ/RimL family protein N-acetyltransferase
MALAASGATLPRIVVRAPGERDIPGLIDLVNALAAEVAALFINPIDRATGPEALRAHLAAMAQSGSEAVLVAERDGTIAGLLTVRRGAHPATRGVAEIAVGVAAAQRRHGIGRALLSALDRWAEGERVHRLQLNVVTSNAPAIALYRERGYEIEGTLHASARIAGRSVDQLMMAKLL